MDKQKFNKLSITLVTSKPISGGSIYEKNIDKVLNDKYKFQVLELDSNRYGVIKSNRIKYSLQIYFPLIPKSNILICNIAGLVAGVPLGRFNKKVLIIHHYDPIDSNNPLFRILFYKIIVSKLPRFDKIVVVCEHWKKHLSEYIGEDKIEIIYNSFYIKEIYNIINNIDRIEFKKKYNIPLDKTIVYAGNATEYKGIKLTTELLKNTNYHVITSGKKDNDYESQHLLLTYEDYIRLLKIADVSVLLSKFNEGWNRCAHESILCGTPVIGHNTAGLGELLIKTKQTIYKDGEDLVKLIENAISDKTRVKYGSEFLKKYDPSYFRNSWDSLLTVI